MIIALIILSIIVFIALMAVAHLNSELKKQATLNKAVEENILFVYKSLDKITRVNAHNTAVLDQKLVDANKRIKILYEIIFNDDDEHEHIEMYNDTITESNKNSDVLINTDRVNEILDKIRDKGIESLTHEERNYLDSISND
jgi:lipopolysaccharide export LptBFGC system permease protein LptF